MAIEIEDKFDVPVEYEIPELTGIRGCAQVVGPKTHQLVAIYFDTPDLRLAARGITLRRRRGGADPGWHLKLPKAKGVRQEITHPSPGASRWCRRSWPSWCAPTPAAPTWSRWPSSTPSAA
ncbi:CYTH domain-containing protein [Thermocatellispora tengchongensis]|uniref:CYTH domain-containing protein n=1 Tax=Thermocatellispora tengchongensis TaxID=1073253 RepID=UPI00362EA9F5